MNSEKRLSRLMLIPMLLALFAIPQSASAKETALTKVKSVKLDNSSYKQLTVTWQRVSGADGYEVRYSKKESMKKSTTVTVEGRKNTSCTIGDLTRKKVYYVEVRAYQKKDGKTVYGPYSRIKHKKVKGKLIVVGAGHQTHGNSSLEPNGPGSSTMKAKVSTGTAGCVTHTPEYKLNLQVAKRLRTELESRGYDVKMIRTTNNVNISNAERAKKANKWGADAVIHIHANSDSNSSTHGVLTISPTSSNPYPIRSLYSKCYNLSKCVVDGVCSRTGAYNRGVWQTDTMTGINWSEVPVTYLEMGFMSNPTEDRNMGTKAYKRKIVKGVADGLDAYFGRS